MNIKKVEMESSEAIQIRWYHRLYMGGDLTELEFLLENVIYIRRVCKTLEKLYRVQHVLEELGWWERIDHALGAISSLKCTQCDYSLTTSSEYESDDNDDGDGEEEAEQEQEEE